MWLVRKFHSKVHAELRKTVQTDSPLNINFKFIQVYFIDPCLSQLIPAFQSPVGGTHTFSNNSIKAHTNINSIILFIYLFTYLFIYLFIFLGPHSWHMEVPRLGVESELQLPAYATATAMWDLSCICNQHHSSRPCCILKPLSKARDRTHILMDSRWVHYH